VLGCLGGPQCELGKKESGSGEAGRLPGDAISATLKTTLFRKGKSEEQEREGPFYHCLNGGHEATKKQV